MDNTDHVETKSMGRPRGGDNNTKLSEDIEHHRTYHRNYYRNKLCVKVECPFCHRASTLQKLSRHQQTKLCFKNRDGDNID